MSIVREREALVEQLPAERPRAPARPRLIGSSLGDLRADVALHAHDLDARAGSRARRRISGAAAMSTPNFVSRRPVEM